MQLDPSETRVVRGVTLRRDPAREDCFVIGHHETEVQAARDYGSVEAVRSMLHREYNNETQNTEVAAQTLVDFPDAPWELRMQLARQCWDETRHARMFLRRVIELGGRKGESPIKNGDWSIVGMIDSLPGRMLVQHRLFEGGVLDSFRQVARGFRESGDARTAEIFEVILADEIQHVRFANQWLRHFCKQPRAVMQMAAALNFAAGVFRALQPKPGERSVDDVDLAGVDHSIVINSDDRQHAGFTAAEIADLMQKDSQLEQELNA
ncbi:MAG TPA: DUF455 family protein [Thermoanaerobaculia bacterium]|nr:DUF455 family protein [Thermoanaerobaculia bacterium]